MTAGQVPWLKPCWHKTGHVVNMHVDLAVLTHYLIELTIHICCHIFKYMLLMFNAISAWNRVFSLKSQGRYIESHFHCTKYNWQERAALLVHTKLQPLPSIGQLTSRKGNYSSFPLGTVYKPHCPQFFPLFVPTPPLAHLLWMLMYLTVLKTVSCCSQCLCISLCWRQCHVASRFRHTTIFTN